MLDALIDFETTAPLISADLLEVGILFLSSERKVVHTYHRVFKFNDEVKISNLSEWHKKNFKDNGLLAECLKSDLDQSRLEEDLLKFCVDNQIPLNKYRFVGINIFLDVGLMMTHCPKITTMMSFKHLDLASINYLFLEVNKSLYAQRPKRSYRSKEAHRVVNDNNENLKLYMFYLNSDYTTTCDCNHFNDDVNDVSNWTVI